MTPTDFANWLQGYIDACGGSLDAKQTEAILAKARTVQPVKMAPPVNQPIIHPLPYVPPTYIPTPPVHPDLWWGPGITITCDSNTH